MEKQKVKVIVRPGKDLLSAEVVDLPGCFSSGDDINHLKEMLREAIDLHVEGLLENGDDVPIYIKEGKFDFEFLCEDSALYASLVKLFPEGKEIIPVLEKEEFEKQLGLDTTGD